MKIGDQLHGFKVVRISPKGLITWRCTAHRCVSQVRLRPGVIDDWMRQHQQLSHPAPIAWPFPAVYFDGVPTSPVLRARDTSMIKPSTRTTE